MAGMVLVDGSYASPHPDQSNPSWILEREFLEFTAPIGIPRLFGYCGNDAALRAAECTFNDARENAGERETFRESGVQAAAAGDIGDLPLLAISRDTASNKASEHMQEELTRLSTHSTLVIAKGSGHYIQNDRPDIVIEAVHNVVDQARKNSAAPHEYRK